MSHGIGGKIMVKTSGKVKRPTRRATVKAPPKAAPTDAISARSGNDPLEELKAHELDLRHQINAVRVIIQRDKGAKLKEAKAKEAALLKTLAGMQMKIDDLERANDSSGIGGKIFSAPMTMKELEKYTRFDYSKLKRHCDENPGVRVHVSGHLFKFDTGDDLFKELPLKMSEKTRLPRKPRGRHKPKIG